LQLLNEDEIEQELAARRGGWMDALHVAAALQIQADELITTEKPTKPMHRVREIQIVSI